MADRLFDRLEQEAFRAGIQARTKESMAWFRRRVQNLRVSRRGLIAQGPQRKRVLPYGRMFNFQYDPKLKTVLPYYDRFPLCIPIQKAKGGFHGMNLHYLHPVVRARFLDALMNFANNDKYNRSTKMLLSYQLLKSTGNLKEFKPCFKHYLNEHIVISPGEYIVFGNSSNLNENGEVNETSNPNGSSKNIAGILNKEKNILGMMPHPERMIDKYLSGDDGIIFFETLLNNLK